MKIRFIKFSEYANEQILERQHDSDTGADIHMIYPGEIQPRTTLVIPLGFGIEVPNGYTARMQVRTSVAKRGIIIQGCAIDAGYTGELNMILHNISNVPFSWEKGDRLGYIEVYPVVYPDFVQKMSHNRGDNAFGSTGR